MMLRRTLVALALLLALAAVSSGCGQKSDQSASSATSDSLLATSPIEQPQGGLEPQAGVQPEPTPAQTPAPAPAKKPAPPLTKKPATSPAAAATTTVPGGTPIKIGVDVALNTETAHAGDPWSGTVKEAVTIGSSAPFPAGSVVHGVVSAVKSAEKGSRAFFVLRITSIEANGRTHEIGATADSMIAGSTTKRNVGAIAGGAAAGALLGKAIGGSGKGALIGGVLGGAAATGAVAASKGFQVEVKQGQELVFHVDTDTKVKL
ncbi:MAG: hypothetical protein IT347_12200 [Candidatus Eisenbacteria bacterium]|nr:hypothetical protein [Candidatus Eisenbacteria bacterium]